MGEAHRLTAILPSNDLDKSEAFYAKLGFRRDGYSDGYRILRDGKGGELHLTAAAEGWVVPERNPLGVYLYAEDVDALAGRMGARAEEKPWRMYEFAVSDPDGTLVRVGRPARQP